jgi:hypothetical protein
MLRIPHCLDNRLTRTVVLSDLRAGRALFPRKIFFLFLVFFSVRGGVNPRAMLRLEGLGKFKKIYYLIGTRTREHSSRSWRNGI